MTDFSTMTKERFKTAIEEAFAERPATVGDDDIWHITHPDNDDLALCGEDLRGDQPIVPDVEVPDEETCIRCRRLAKL